MARFRSPRAAYSALTPYRDRTLTPSMAVIRYQPWPDLLPPQLKLQLAAGHRPTSPSRASRSPAGSWSGRWPSGRSAGAPRRTPPGAGRGCLEQGGGRVDVPVVVALGRRLAVDHGDLPPGPAAGAPIRHTARATCRHGRGRSRRPWSPRRRVPRGCSSSPAWCAARHHRSAPSRSWRRAHRPGRASRPGTGAGRRRATPPRPARAHGSGGSGRRRGADAYRWRAWAGTRPRGGRWLQTRCTSQGTPDRFPAASSRGHPSFGWTMVLRGGRRVSRRGRRPRG